ncbi:MAG: PDZ domain-containing protein [Ignavibacteria bacterium]|nr:PDZ domain-containing protein [Ignavibacteria bacterium]
MSRRFHAKFAAILSLLILGLVFTALGQTTKCEDQKQGWLGVSISNVSSAQAKKMDLKDTDGAYVSSVTKKSPAEAAGLTKGDIIIEFAGRKIFDPDDLSKTVKRTAPETKTSVTVIRDKTKKTLSVTVGTLPPPEKSLARAFQIASPHMTWFGRGGTVGLKLIELNSQLAEYFGAPDGEGVLVEEVRKESAAAKAGFKAGDVILRWGSKRVDEIGDIQKAVREGEAGDNVDVEVLRKGSRQKLTVVLEEAKGHGYELRVFPGVEPRLRIFKHPHGEEFDRFIELESIKPKTEELKIRIEEYVRELKEKNLQLEEGLRDKIRSIRVIREI